MTELESELRSISIGAFSSLQIPKQDELSKKMISLNVSLTELNSSLRSAESDLIEAENERLKAESKKDDAVIGTVAGGVGAVFLGILFPPSLAVTIPAVAAGGTIIICIQSKSKDSGVLGYEKVSPRINC